MIRKIIAAWSVLAFLGLATGPVIAQQGNPFAAAVTVNDRIVTNFEVTERINILRLFRTPGDLNEQAIEDLIDDRLRLDAAARLGITVPPEAEEAGMAEFAGRVNLEVEEFLEALDAEGVSAQTFRDFIKAGVVWREVVSALFGPRAQVTDTEVDRAVSLSGRRGGVEVLLAEIILPARDPEEAARSQAIASDITSNVRSTGAFSAAARQHSAAPSAARGGRTDQGYTPLSELPPSIRAQVLTLSPGQMTAPLSGGNVIALFQVLDLRESRVVETTNVSLEYAIFLIPGGRSPEALQEAAKVTARVDSCNDLYGVNYGQSPDRLVVETRKTGEIPGDIARELSRLDPGEISTALTRGPNLAMLMLCNRTPILGEEEPNRDAVRNALRAERITSYGAAFLEQLRSEAIIRYP